MTTFSFIYSQASRLLFKFRFGRFGKGSLILQPCMLVNPSCIEIDGSFFMREFGRLEAIRSDGLRCYSPKILIGRNTHIEQFFHVSACERIEIGEQVLIGSRVYITDHNHTFADPSRSVQEQGITPGGPVVIGRNSWLGEGSVILPGVTIGEHAIIGANAVVTRDVPAFSVAAGNPAKVIKRYNWERKEWELAR